MDTSPDTDLSYFDLEKAWKANEKRFQDFHSQLADFPHTFQLEETLTADQLRYIQVALESALRVGYKTSTETARARNLLAYVQFRLGHPEDALWETEMALNSEGQQQNIVSLANKAILLWHQQERIMAEEQVQKLHKIKLDRPDFAYLLTKAKAELAFTYTRLDPSFFPHAQRLFSEVVQDAKEPEKWLWQFGLALTQRRSLRWEIRPGSADQEDYLTVLRLFLEIVNNCDSNSMKAKAYAEIAWVLFMSSSEPLKDILQKEAALTVSEACDRALAHDKNDNSVLWKCGKHYRYLRQLEKSCKLLKQAVSARPTSKAYHHLGLTYKSLALQKREESEKPATDQLEDMPTADPTVDRVSAAKYRIFKTQMSRSVSTDSQGSGTADSQPSSPLGPAEPALVSCQENEAPGVSPDTKEDEQGFTSEAFKLWKMIKSPLKGYAVSLSEDEFYAREAIDSLSQAVEISQWENTRAIYDLALMYKSLDQLELAKESLEKLIRKRQQLNGFDKVNFFEQLGLILRDMAEKQTNEEDKKQLLQKSDSMLLTALKEASAFASKSPVKDHIGDIWHSFHTLLEAVDNDQCSVPKKLREKALLFRLIRNHKQSLAFLQEIKNKYPQEENEPKQMKLAIENYVEIGHYEKAATLVNLLQCTSQSVQANEHYLHKIYLQAAKQSLLRDSPDFASHFRSVFDDVGESDQLTTSSEDTDTTEDKIKMVWEVLILHEETENDTDLALAVAAVLKHGCGLKVTRLDEEALLGTLKLEGVLRVMRRSKVVVVLAGHHKVSSELRFFISQAAKRRDSTVTLLVNGDHVPKSLKTHRSMVLPPELLQITTALDSEEFAEQRVAAICKIFGILVNIDLTDTCSPLHSLSLV